MGQSLALSSGCDYFPSQTGFNLQPANPNNPGQNTKKFPAQFFFQNETLFWNFTPELQPPDEGEMFGVNSQGNQVFDDFGALQVTSGLLPTGTVTITVQNLSSTESITSLGFTCTETIAPPPTKQFIGQGPDLVGTGVVGNGLIGQGESVALSADGNTAIVGGPGDNASTGAAWVYTRNEGTWNQQGPKLVGSGSVGGARQGQAVAISGDASTVIIGGHDDNGGIGAGWVFVQSGGLWTQQGSKLVGSGAIGSANQGYSVALSADGNTAVLGGVGDNASAGAAWIFTRSGGVWTQQAKLVGTGAVGAADQGGSVALSADGNTLVIGGSFDNSNAGAAWVFTQSGGVWTQQAKLVGTGAIGSAWQGSSVALSADGNTIVSGGPVDNSQIGAAWVFTQSGGVWTQQAKLVGTGGITAQQGDSVAVSGNGTTVLVGGPDNAANNFVGATWVFNLSGGVWNQTQEFVGAGNTGQSSQGDSVSLSSDGNTGLVGGPTNNSSLGAAWVFVAHNWAATHDFNGDFISDVLWRDTSGDIAMWLMKGNATPQAAFLSKVSGWSVVGQRDFTGGGDADILWRDGSGNLAIWFMNGPTVSSAASFGNVTPNWTVYGTGDLNGDGVGDILWMDNDGNVAVWFMKDGQVASVASLGQVTTNWTIIGDDSHGDIFWQDTAGDLAIWQVNGSKVVASAVLATAVPNNWVIAGLSDFDGNGVTDILWRDSNSGTVAIWFMVAGASVGANLNFGAVASTWSIVQTGDYNGDGYGDILWIDNIGNVAAWFMNAGSVSSTASYGNVAGWQVQSINAE